MPNALSPLRRAPAPLLVALILWPAVARPEVSSFGAFTTEVPIKVPPYHGLEPPMRLAYASGGGSGVVGVGWDLAATSYIDRVSAHRGTPRLDATDLFLLDGVELVPCPPDTDPTPSPSCTTARSAFGSSAGYFSTRWESFERIRREPNDEWTVWSKDGTKRTYRRVQETRIGTTLATARWGLVTVVDTSGNRVEYSYWNEGSSTLTQAYLDKIEYNRIGAWSYGSVIQLGYETRPDPTSYGNGLLVTMRHRLKTIDVVRGLPDGSQKRLRAYALSYGAPSAASGASLLRSVQELGTDGVTSQPAIRFTYDESAQGRIALAATSTQPNDLNPTLNRVLHGDFNGDGRSDIMTAHEKFETWLGQADGSYTLVESTAPAPNWCLDCDFDTPPGSSGTKCTGPDGRVGTKRPMASGCLAPAQRQVATGDFNGDGATDFAVSKPYGPIYTYHSTRDGNYVFAGATAGALEGHVMAGDYNGDGKADLLVPGDAFEVYLSQGDGTFARRFGTAVPNWCFDTVRRATRAAACLNTTCGENCIHSGDFNGDGLTDLLSAGQNFDFFFAKGDGTFEAKSTAPPAACAGWGAEGCLIGYSNLRNHVVAGDFNGDGRTDLVAARSTFMTFLSEGAGSFSVVQSSPPAHCASAEACLSSEINDVVVGDFNGDRRADILSANLAFDTWLGAGDGRFRFLSTAAPAGGAAADYLESAEAVDETGFPTGVTAGLVAEGDLDGDGKTDLSSAALGNNTAFTFKAQGGPTDHLVRVDGSLGGVTEIAYAPATTWSRTYLPMGMSFQTVRSVTVSNGLGASAQTFTHAYANALWSNAERRFLGYGWMEVADGRGTRTTTSFLQNDQCAGRPAFTTIADDANQAFLYRSSAYGGNASPPYSCLPTASYDYECNGNTLPFRMTATEMAANEYGDVKELTEHGAWTLAGDERFTLTEFKPNETDYIVVPAYVNIHAGTSTQGPLLSRKRMVYDANANETQAPTQGKLAKVLLWNDRTGLYETIAYERDAWGNITKTIDPAGFAVSTELDPTYHAFPVNVCSCAVGTASCNRFCTATAWDYVLGAATKVTDANQQVTQIQYDELGRVRLVVMPDGGSISTSYVGMGNASQQRVRVSRADGSPDGLWSEQYLDGLGRAYLDVREGGFMRRTVYVDASDRPERISDWYLPGETPVEETFRYDALKRLVRVTHADGSFVATSFVQDAATVQVTTTDELGHPRHAFLDGFGRLASVREEYKVKDSGSCAHRVEVQGVPLTTDCSPAVALVCNGGVDVAGAVQWGDDYCCTREWDSLCVQEVADWTATGQGVEATTKYIYDALGRLRTVIDAGGNASSSDWDSLGRKLQTCNPDMGCWQFSYLANGALSTQTDALGRMTQMSYDVYGRSKGRTELDPSVGVVRNVSFLYDVDAQGNAHGASEGRLVAVVDPSGSTEQWYDGMGRVTKARKCVKGTCMEQGQGYDLAGRILTVTYPDAGGGLSSASETLRYQYDPYGRLSSVAPYVTSYQYWSNGAVKKIGYLNNTATDFYYHPTRRWLTTLSVYDLNRTTLYAALYGHDSDGRIDTMVVANPTWKTMTFGYDDLHRLTSVRSGFQQDLAYDLLGNIVHNSLVGNYTYPASGRHGCGRFTPCKGPHAVAQAGSDTYAYDANGNMTQGGSRTFLDWDHMNLPGGVETGGQTTRFTYDGLGARVEKVDPTGARTRYFGNLLEVAPSGAVVKSYYAAGRLVARRDENGTLLYYHTDHLGSPRLLTDSSGKAVKRYDYAPFGEETDLNPAISVNRPTGFAGHERDPETGLVYMGARYYDPRLARFISADTLVPSLANPQALNRYTYVYNNPLGYTDPTGHKPSAVAAHGDFTCVNGANPNSWCNTGIVDFGDWLNEHTGGFVDQFERQTAASRSVDNDDALLWHWEDSSAAPQTTAAETGPSGFGLTPLQMLYDMTLGATKRSRARKNEAEVMVMPPLEIEGRSAERQAAEAQFDAAKKEMEQLRPALEKGEKEALKTIGREVAGVVKDALGGGDGSDGKPVKSAKKIADEMRSVGALARKYEEARWRKNDAELQLNPNARQFVICRGNSCYYRVPDPGGHPQGRLVSEPRNGRFSW